MRVLVACEESQRVCAAFRDKGHEAYSCDILEPSGCHPEWHIHADVTPLINGHCSFQTMDEVAHNIPGEWDLLIAHPPCTYLTVTGNRWFDIDKYGEKAIQRYKYRAEAIKFFMLFVHSNAKRICIENPAGVMSTYYRKPDQYIQPYQFGHPISKKTGLWLFNLPKLTPTNIVKKNDSDYYGFSYDGNLRYATDENGKILKYSDPKTAIIRSKTYPGIALAMAEQWG